jgi:hypothetical protein
MVKQVLKVIHGLEAMIGMISRHNKLRRYIMAFDIMRRHQIFFVIVETVVIGCLVAGIVGCKQGDEDLCSNTKPESEIYMVDEICRTLDDCIPWSQINANDVNSRNKVMDCMEKLSGYDLDILQKAVEKYVLNKEKLNSYDEDSMSRLYVLNRYIFNVPAKKTEGIPGFWGLFGDANNSGGVDGLWPLSFDDKGHLALTGTFGGYLGEPFMAVEEFKYFKEHYGVRKIKRGENKK